MGLAVATHSNSGRKPWPEPHDATGGWSIAWRSAAAMGQLAVDEDVAVAGRAALAGNRVRDQRAPEHRPGQAVDRQVVRLLEHHHRAARDLAGAGRDATAAAARAACAGSASGSARAAASVPRRARRRSRPGRRPPTASSRAAGSRDRRAAAAAAGSSPRGPARRACASRRCRHRARGVPDVAARSSRASRWESRARAGGT